MQLISNGARAESYDDIAMVFVEKAWGNQSFARHHFSVRRLLSTACDFVAPILKDEVLPCFAGRQLGCSRTRENHVHMFPRGFKFSRDLYQLSLGPGSDDQSSPGAISFARVEPMPLDAPVIRAFSRLLCGAEGHICGKNHDFPPKGTNHDVNANCIGRDMPKCATRTF